ncbi:hypothetical protein BpHYR1_003217 [Brachionus plicatilis]|uniref:RNA-directed DNA polymerase from mobile element jockey-like n=1 Tax=Brachionus plicatilis TaxID=10195 RepID=A0A3M7PSS4_BRAPC|nr:hypothetical protein BpHYR1_003217 [Brachionus plicatilis]
MQAINFGTEEIDKNLFEWPQLKRKFTKTNFNLIFCLPNFWFSKIKYKIYLNRRRRDDLIQLHKINHGFDRVELIHGYQFLASNKLDSPAGGTRRGQLSIERQLVRNCRARYNFFTNRTAGNWNALDVETRRINCLVLTEQSNVDKQTNNLTFRMENMDRKCWSHAVKAGNQIAYIFCIILSNLRSASKKVLKNVSTDVGFNIPRLLFLTSLYDRNDVECESLNFRQLI